MAQPLVLCVQDGTELNYTNLAQCQGLAKVSDQYSGSQFFTLSTENCIPRDRRKTLLGNTVGQG